MGEWKDPKPSSRAVLLGGLWLLAALTVMVVLYASVFRPLLSA